MSQPDSRIKDIQSLKRRIEAGTISKELGEQRIAKLENGKPNFVARWTLANGKDATKRGFKTEKEAAAYQFRQREKVVGGDASRPKDVKASVVTILDFYESTKLKPKASSARAHLKVCKQLIGNLRLDKINAHADEILNEYIFETAAEVYENRKTLWNHKVYIQAAFGHWIRKKRIQMVNPWVVIDFPTPVSRRTTTPDFKAYTDILSEASKPERPNWVRVVFILAREQGRRGGEIHLLDWRDIHLNPLPQDRPWMLIRTLKQNKETFDEIPLYAGAAEALRGIWEGQTEGRVFPLLRSGHDKIIRAVMDAAGYPDLWLHDFRRYWNNRHQHISQKQRMDMDGHRDPKMDDYYRTERRKALESIVDSSYAGSLSGVQE